jgi:hypothetical protein
MVVVLLAGGIVFVLAGVLAVLFGLPVKEFSFGNTLILSGAILACTGAIMLAIWILIRELKKIAAPLGLAGFPGSRPAALPSTNLDAALGSQAVEDGGFLFSRDQPSAEPAAGHAEPAPWHDEAGSRERGRGEAPPAPEPVEPAAKQRRNLLFSSSSRKERERVQARTPDMPAADPRAPAVAALPPAEPAEAEAPPATFEDAWPKSERARTAEVPPPRRGGRAPPTSSEPAAAAPLADRYPPAVRSEGQPQVTVLKSGVVDGMAYSLYSDGSIEAQMPEGMMRFASIDELRSHLDQRP